MLYELAEIAKKEIAKYSDDYEVYLENTNVLQLDAQKSDLNFAKNEASLGLGIRVIKDGKIGFAYTSDMDKISETAEKAVSNSKLNSVDENFGFAEVEDLPKIKGTFDKKFQDLELDELTETMKSVLATVSENGCEATSGGFSSAEGETLIINSNGVSAYDKSTGFGIGVSINAEKDGELATAYDSDSSCMYNLDGVKVAENVCELAINSLGSKHIETDDKEVVLDYHGAVGLLSTFLSGFNADNVQRGRSILGNKLNEKILSENLSIYDDGTYEGGLGSGVCDGEGTASKRTNLVENGILKSFIYDIYTANKGGVSSTANGFRGSFGGTPSVGSSNIIFDFKERTDISEIKNGFFATDVLGAHTANPISGDFSVEANNAFLIENGEITTPVKKAMISGNIYEVLANCEAVGKETKQKASFVLPRILLHDLRVVGN